MMKKRLRRNNFNMVEIMLAVIVIALGIAGTFVLFPVGLNANKDATAENSIADIAEYVTAFVRAQCMTGGISGNAGNPFATDASALSSVFCDKDTTVADPVDVDNLSGSNWKAASGSSSDSVDLAKDALLKHSNGIYLYRQFSGPATEPYVDFSAIARVYIDKSGTNASGFGEEYFIDITGVDRQYKNLSDVDIRKFLIPVVLELSWPATVPELEREKRYFRFEIFNNQYEISKDTAL